jgi:regulatory protein
MVDVPAYIITQMERFCAWQERCPFDVRRKLNSYHLSEEQEETVIKYLKENQFLDENRYVESFVRSKVKAAWGKQKIVAALRAKQIPSALIDQYCAEISTDDYTEKLRQSIEKWQRSHPDVENARTKLIRHLLSKGYGMEEVMREIKN